MELKQLGRDFAVCKLKSTDHVNLSNAFVFLARTDEEISLVYDAADIPADATDIERGWKGLRIKGVLDFGMTGVIAKLANHLAAARIGIFVCSTYNTDYVLLKSDQYRRAVDILRENGYAVD